MKYRHTVKHNGQYYPAGVDVPEKITDSSAEVKKPSALFSDEEFTRRKPGRPRKEQ